MGSWVVWLIMVGVWLEMIVPSSLLIITIINEDMVEQVNVYFNVLSFYRIFTSHFR